jgi:uncharacterized protein
MKVTRDPLAQMTIRRISRGEIQIGNESVRHDVLLTIDQAIRPWTASDIAALDENDFTPVIESQPEIIVLGTGWQPRFPPRELIFAMARRGIGFETMNTPAACRTFNILLNEGRRAAAVLIVDDPDDGT